MRISSQILEIDLALYFGKIGKPHRENFHLPWERVPFTIPCGSGSLKLLVANACLEIYKSNHQTTGKLWQSKGAGASPAPTTSSKIVGATLAVAPNAVAPDRRVTVGDYVGAYKSLVANACLKIYKSNHQTMGKLWQRNFGKIGKPYSENFHFPWEKVPFTIPGGSGSLNLKASDIASACASTTPAFFRRVTHIG